MAVRTKSNTSTPNKKVGVITQIRNLINNEQLLFIVGLLLSFTVIYASVAVLSYFFTGEEDQSKIENLPLSDLFDTSTRVMNWCGIKGAYIAELLVNRMFGISSVLLLYFFGVIALRLMRVTRVKLLKQYFFSIAYLFWGSYFFGFLSRYTYDDLFLYLGGHFGYVMATDAMLNYGTVGAFLILLGSWLVIAIVFSKKIIPLLKRVSTLPITFFLMIIKKIYREKDKDYEDDCDKENEVESTSDKFVSEEKTPLLSDPKPMTFEIEIAKGDEPEIADEDKAEFQVNDPIVEEKAEDSQMADYNPRLDLSQYQFPSTELLKHYETSDFHIDYAEQEANQQKILQTLKDFGIKISSIKATVGPTITLYEVVPDTGIRISKIKNLGDDIALNLSALGIRIIAPMPGKGTVGIEVPNKEPQIVSMQSVIATKKFKECRYDLPVVLGKTITNEVFMFDLCKMPHLLVAGATGQGKSVGLNAIITSLLYKKHPSELKFVMIDPKMVEFSIYSSIEKHYLAKLPDADKAIITDFSKVTQTLNSLCQEMDERYDLLMKAHARNVKEYNEKFIQRRLSPEKGHKYMPFIVVIIDEFGDLIMTAGKEIEMPIARIAQKARAVGMHMVIATQRPTTTIITGTIKANFPARLAFKVSSMIDSRTILDAPGANQLIGRGDLLFSQGSEMTRVQCAFIDTPEVENLSNFIGDQRGYPTAFHLPEYSQENETKGSNGIDLSDRDPLFDEAARLIVLQQQGSTSLIQRKFAIGYNRAGRLMDQLEAAGIVGPIDGSKPRQVLIMEEYSLEQVLNSLNK